MEDRPVSKTIFDIVEEQNNPQPDLKADNFKPLEVLDAQPDVLQQSTQEIEPASSSPADPQAEAASQPERPQAVRFKTLREEKERAERERDDALRELQRSRQERNTSPAHAPEYEADDGREFDINNEDLVEGKHLKKLYKHVQQLQSKVDNYERNSASSNDETWLKVKYPDIEEVVTPENMELLRDIEPEIWQTIQNNPNFRSKAIAARNIIKKLGIVPDNKPQPDRDRALRNAYKPRPASSINTQQSDSPLQHANAFASGLTEELKKQLYNEMLEARRGY